MSYDTVVWLPNALILTALLGAFAVWRWRRKGALTGLRWVGVAMLPLALYGVGLFRFGWSVGLAASRFVTGFAFRPSVWLGLILGVVAVGLIILPSKLDKQPATAGAVSGSGSAKPAKRLTSTKSKGKDAAVDNDMAEIQDILKKHGIG